MAQKSYMTTAKFGSGKGNTLRIQLNEIESDRPDWWDIDVQTAILQINQKHENSCSYACKKAIDQLIGAGLDEEKQKGMNNRWETITESNAIGNHIAKANYRYVGYTILDYTGALTKSEVIPWMIERINLGEVIQISFKLTDDLSHASLVNRVRAKNDYSRIKINIMNPDSSGSRKYFNKICPINQIFSIANNG